MFDFGRVFYPVLTWAVILAVSLRKCSHHRSSGLLVLDWGCFLYRIHSTLCKRYDYRHILAAFSYRLPLTATMLDRVPSCGGHVECCGVGTSCSEAFSADMLELRADLSHDDLRMTPPV